MKIEKVKLSTLVPLEKNVRKHTERQIEEFKKSISQFGQTRPFVIDENNSILIGNGMYMAIKGLGIEDVFAYRVKGFSEAQKKKLILSDNKIYALAFDDIEVIEEYVKELSVDSDFDIPGYDEETLREIAKTAEEIINQPIDYGKIEGKGEKKNENVDDVLENPDRYTSPPSQEVKEEASHSEEENSGAPVETAAATERYITCPKCGERIRL